MLFMPEFSTVLKFINDNKMKWFKSPRTYFKRGREAQDFRIIECDQRKERIKMEFRSGTLLPIEFWRFKETISLLNNENYIPIGSRISENTLMHSVEGHLKLVAKKMYDRETDTKTAPHVVDILVLAGIAELGYAISESCQEVQGVKRKSNKTPSGKK